MSLLSLIKEEIKNIYLEQLEQFRKNKYIETSKIEDNNHMLLFYVKNQEKFENIVNEEIENFTCKIIIDYIMNNYSDKFNKIISLIVENNIQNSKAKIINDMQKEIENGSVFKELFKEKKKLQNNYFKKKY